MAIIVTEDYAYQYWLDKAKAEGAPERYIAEIERRRDESAAKVRKEIFI